MRTPSLPLTLVTLTALAGCSYNSAGMGDYGVTPGGVQDIDHARELISEGRVPSIDDFTAEGLFSQHSLPLDGPECNATLCPRAAAAAIRPVDATSDKMLVQLGFGTDIDPDNFVRASLDLAVAIDISGSMSGDKLDTAKASLHEIIDQLDADDQMALITYGSKAKVVQSLATMDDQGRQAMHNQVNKLSSAGSTAMEDGLSSAIAELAGARQDAGARIFLLTDAQPNVGATDSDSFVALTQDAAAQGIGLTVWGVGLDLGSELTEAISQVRGGNAWFFRDMDTMTERVQEEFPFIVTPLAYDLAVQAVPAEGLQLDRPWGAPVDEAATEVAFGASTLFLSLRDGGMGITLDVPKGVLLQAEAGMPVVDMAVSWVPVDGSARVDTQISATFDGGEAYTDGITAADDEGVFRMAALVDEVLALEAGAAWCAGELDEDTAVARIDEASQRLLARSTDHADEALLAEAELMTQLADNVLAGIDRCN